MKKEISNIIAELVGQMDCTIVGVWNANESRTDVCKTKWLRPGQTVLDDQSNGYAVLNVESDEWITTEPDELSGVIELKKPYFITGTRLAANSEWTKATPILMQKLPLIWLLEVIRYRKFGRESAIDFTTDLRMFFLDETNVAQWYTADHRENVVNPMEELANEFIETIGRDRSFATVDEFEMITFSRFGVERENGMFQNILDANLSGVELRITLNRFKQNCKC